MKVTPLDADYRADMKAIDSGHHAQHDCAGGLGRELSLRYDRPDRRDRRAGPETRDRAARRRLPGRILPPLGRKARARGAAVRLPRAGRDFDVVRYAQVRLRAQGHFGRAVSRAGAAALSSTSPSPIGRAGCTTRPPSPAAAPADSAPPAGRRWCRWASRATRKPPKASSTPWPPCTRASPRSPGCRVLGQPLGPFAVAVGRRRHLPGDGPDVRIAAGRSPAY